MPNRLLVFSSEDCAVCKSIKPMVDEETKRAGVEVEEHDPIAEPAFAQRFDVLTLPTLVLLQNDEFMGELRGFVDQSSLRGLLRLV